MVHYPEGAVNTSVRTSMLSRSDGLADVLSCGNDTWGHTKTPVSKDPFSVSRLLERLRGALADSSESKFLNRQTSSGL